MDQNPNFIRQVNLIVRLLPVIAANNRFGLKGGTAINLFLQEMPRLSVDIDLVFLPRLQRDSAISEIRRQLNEICLSARETIPQLETPNIYRRRGGTIKQLIRVGDCDVRIEVSTITRETVWPCQIRRVSRSVEDHFGYAEANVASFYDAYAGKICAALDRQHVRDLFDIRQLLLCNGIGRNLFKTFLVYLISSNRPIADLIDPKMKEISLPQMDDLNEMIVGSVSSDDLRDSRAELVNTLHSSLTSRDREFLISLKRNTLHLTIMMWSAMFGIGGSWGWLRLSG